MKNNADITLVICNYNRAEFIDRAIRSCLNQFIMNRKIEVIVVDDASTDNSISIIQEFNDEIKLHKIKKNKGVAFASNIGLKKATGQYWMRVDSDDFLNTYACNFMTMILDENPSIDFVYADHYRVDTHGIKQERIRLDNQKILYEHGAGILFRTEILKKVGGYNNKLRNCEDYDLLLRLKKSGFKGYYLPVPLYRYYIHGKNITLTPSRKKFKKIVKETHGI